MAAIDPLGSSDLRLRGRARAHLVRWGATLLALSLLLPALATGAWSQERSIEELSALERDVRTARDQLRSGRLELRAGALSRLTELSEELEQALPFVEGGNQLRLHFNLYRCKIGLALWSTEAKHAQSIEWALEARHHGELCGEDDAVGSAGVDLAELQMQAGRFTDARD